MTTQFKSLFLLLLLAPQMGWSQNKHVSIRISQDDAVILDKYENDIVLEKKSFKIQVLLDNVSGVYVFAAFSDSICCRLSELDTIAGLGDLPDRTMREAEFNKEKELLVNDDNSCAYWYYSKETPWHGFNKKIILLDSGRIVAVKTVKQLYDVPSQREIKLKEMKAPLYLLFVAVSEFDPSGKPIRELMRRKVRINWVEDDD